MNIQAPDVMKTWYEFNQSQKSFKDIETELRLPSSDDSLNKASLLLDASPLLCSLTIWGNGMISYIVVDAEKDVDICSSDFESKDKNEIISKLDEYLTEFLHFMRD